MVKAEGLKIFDIRCHWGSIFVFLKKIFASEVFFSLLHMLGNLLEKLSWAHVLRAPIPFKWYQSTSGCCTENST